MQINSTPIISSFLPTMDNCYWPQTQMQCHPWLPPSEYGCYSTPPFDGTVEDGAAASASRSHSEAEKRRRDRINSQLATLRKLIPKSEKMDKAALLGQVVEHVKEHKEKAKEASKTSTMPTEMDQVTIDRLNMDADQDSTSQNIMIKASICCEDRPEFFGELKSALKGLGATIVEAEVTSLGGRIKANFIVCAKEENCCNTLKMALSRLALDSGSSTYTTRSKRQRFFYPNSC